MEFDEIQVSTNWPSVQQVTTSDGNDTNLIPDRIIRYHTVDHLSVVICIWILGKLIVLHKK